MCVCMSYVCMYACMYVCIYVSMISHMAGTQEVPDADLRSLHVVAGYSFRMESGVQHIHALRPLRLPVRRHICLVGAPGREAQG